VPRSFLEYCYNWTHCENQCNCTRENYFHIDFVSCWCGISSMSLLHIYTDAFKASGTQPLQPRSYFIFLLTLRKRRNHLRLYPRLIYTVILSRDQRQSYNFVLTLFFCLPSGRDAIICVFTHVTSNMSDAFKASGTKPLQNRIVVFLSRSFF
jgi:hypothetical protein